MLFRIGAGIRPCVCKFYRDLQKGTVGKPLPMTDALV